jgi:hypothetical protein
MMRVITSSVDLENAENLFASRIKEHPHEIVATSIGYQSNIIHTNVIWIPSLDIWAFFGLPPEGKSEGKRYWNAFGIGRPRSLVSIVCEINPSRKGVNRRTKGAFVVDEHGLQLVCHRGMLNISGGMTRGFFREHYRGTWIEADEDGQRSTFVKVAQLNSAELGDAIKDFVFQVDHIKKLARAA